MPHPTDGVTYLVGHNDFTFTWSISDVTTTSSDYSASSGTVTINEQTSGSDYAGVLNLNYYDENRDIDLSIIADGVDEPDTETFTITLAEDDDHGEFKSGTATKNITIKDDPDDQPPYVSLDCHPRM